MCMGSEMFARDKFAKQIDICTLEKRWPVHTVHPIDVLWHCMEVKETPIVQSLDFLFYSLSPLFYSLYSLSLSLSASIV